MRSRVDFGRMLNRLGLTGTGVEMGVFNGEFARQILDTWEGRKLIGVDTWPPEGLAESVRARMQIYGQRWEGWHTESLKAAEKVADNSLDFVYIDADHTYQAARRDLGLWWPKVKPGGVFAGHDYWNGQRDPVTKAKRTILNPTKAQLAEMNFGVKAAVDEFVVQHGLGELQSTKEWPSSWWLRVPTGKANV